MNIMIECLRQHCVCLCVCVWRNYFLKCNLGYNVLLIKLEEFVQEMTKFLNWGNVQPMFESVVMTE